MFRLTLVIATVLFMTLTGAQNPQPTTPATTSDTTSTWRAQEKHLKNVKMLTNGGENAEAYFSSKGDMLIYQTSHPPYECDQIFLMNSDGSDKHLVSTGKGRTTCSFIAPDYQRIIYASTHATDTLCPPKPDFSKGYVWALFDYEI